ncbi:MAG: RDD family protein [Proteobacteria bacterium]|nr:RDD family protein [Pseudomonadota bacterium]
MDSARLARILGAVIYDVVIVVSLIFIAALWFPLIPEHIQEMSSAIWFKRTYYFVISFLYFAYSWRLGGQTIGMKSWRIKIQPADSTRTGISWAQCFIRYLVAILPWILIGQGLNLLFSRMAIDIGTLWVFSWLAIALVFVWITFQQQRSLHDRASGTCLVVQPKKA